MYPMNIDTDPWGYFDDAGIWRTWGAPNPTPRTAPSSPLASFHTQATRAPEGATGNPIVKTPPTATAAPVLGMGTSNIWDRSRYSKKAASVPKNAPKITKLNNTASTIGATAAAKPKGGILKEGGFFDPKSGKLGGIVDKVANPQFDYDAKTGLKGWGRSLGTYWNLGHLALQGYGAVQDLQNAGDYRDRSKDLMSDIVAASYNSPTIQYDLAPDQLETLRKLRDGDYETDTGLGDLDLLGILGDVGMGVLGGIPGGIGGMVLGGLGGLGTSLANDYSNTQSRQTAELEALYQAVLESEKQHNDLRKQRAYASYGLGGY